MQQKLSRCRLFLFVTLSLSFLLAACGMNNASTPPAKALEATHNFVLTGDKGFSPFIQVVPVNTTVAFINNDVVGHNIINTLNSNSFLNPVAYGMTLLPHTQQETTFTAPGIYDIYDNVFATYNDAEQRVTALPQSPVAPYPLAIEGILWVQGDISGLSATADATINTNTHNIDNNFLAITKGGSIAWHNDSTTAVTLQPVPGWQAPINPVALPPITIAGLATVNQTYSTPGLYYFYSPTYADINQTLHRAVSRSTSADFPVAFEGFVLVV